MELHLQAASILGSGLSQFVALKLLEYCGFKERDSRCVKVNQFYLKMRNLALHLVRNHLGDLVDCNDVCNGMFLSLRIKHVEESKKLFD